MNQQEPLQPESQTDKERRDPPESQWPGRWVNEADVTLPSGDDRDWFTLEQRLAAFRNSVERYQRARARR